MKDKKYQFDIPYLGSETIDGISVIYNKVGDCSVVIRCENPVMQYSANVEEYYGFHTFYSNILKILGPGYTIQKQDIFCKKPFSGSEYVTDDYLCQRYFEHFGNRVYTDIETYLVITQHIDRNRFFTYDKQKFDNFLRNIVKIMSLFKDKYFKANLLNEEEITYYIQRYLTVSFDRKTISLKNIKAKNEHLLIGETYVQNISLVDIDEVELPSCIKPFSEVNIGKRFPVDSFSFLQKIPYVKTAIYNQVISIPDQRSESQKLEAKRRKHKGMPDPANTLCVEDIEKVQSDIAREGQILVYSHFNIILCGDKDIRKAANYIESSLFDSGITPNKQCYNQLELFSASLPGNTYLLKEYDRFLTTADAAICFLYKEKLQQTEVSPFLTFYTDRQGSPVGIDISGKEGEVRYTNNSNFFVLGPSGSGKSFFVNSTIRQWVTQNTDIVLVDTGHSYSGLCEYYKGKYITYSKEKPISMNPFRISEEEFNIEKKNFLKSLIFLIWKGANGTISKSDGEVINIVIEKYYSFYFHPFKGFSTQERDDLKRHLLIEYKNNDKSVEASAARAERKAILEKIEKLERLAERGEGGEKENATRAIQNILLDKGYTREELDYEDAYALMAIDQEIDEREDFLRTIKVKNLSFNSFYEFALQMIPYTCRTNKIDFNLTDFKFILKKFYKGGQLERTLNEEFDSSLFNEPFIVFEIDAIKEDEELFPIVTLIIMDVFIQKMRLKKNRKALIIEEAWKAIASPMMANYILYLYKTVRKFWGMAMVVTQELEDIISNPIVKNSIVNNSDILCLLDQNKFKDKYEEIANLLSLSEVDQKQIFTINQLNNKDGRNRFNEVFIKRCNYGNVYGVEVALHEYFTYTTERVEKDAMGYYQKLFRDYRTSLDNFVRDLKQSKKSNGEWSRLVSKALGQLEANDGLDDLLSYVPESELCDYILKHGR